MQNFHLIVIGGSAGGLDALKRLVARLPAGLEAAICIVLHISRDSPGFVPDILQHFGDLPAGFGTDGEKLRGGRIYVAPPDRHLLVEHDNVLRLGAGPKENMFRPAVDPLFRSAAARGPRAVGVVLSGGLDDGAAGLAAMKAAGARTIVQDPADASVPSMPRAALRAVDADHCLPAEAIGDCLVQIIRAPRRETTERVMSDPSTELETEIAAGISPLELDMQTLGKPSMFTCPHCAGVLLELNDPPLRFRCHTGHAYGAQTLAALVTDEAEDTLFAALRALQEKQMLLERLAARPDDSGVDRVSLAGAVRRTRHLVDSVRSLLESNEVERDEVMPG